MEKLKLLYEGKAKRLYETADPDVMIMEFKDSLTAFDGTKRDELLGKGEWNNQISAVVFEYLNGRGIPTHFLKLLSPRESLVKRLKMVPLELVCRNLIAGSMAKRTGLPEGTPFKRPVIEFHFKADELHDPLYTEDLILALEIVTEDELKNMREIGSEVNETLRAFMDERDILLVDFKLEFGYTNDGKLVVGDEITPDTCRLWNKLDMQKLDKDRFRRDLGDVAEAYQDVLSRVRK